MKRIVIDGEVLCTNRMDGIHRFMIEILSRLDNMIDDTSIELHLVHRSSSQLMNLQLNNIMDVPLDCSGKRYRLQVIPEYVRQVNGIYCSMSNDAVRCKNSIFTLMDLIPLYKIAHFPIKALVRMKITYRLMRKYGGTIVTISNESKKDIINKLRISSDRIRIVGTGHEHMNSIVEDDGILSKYPEIVRKEYYYAIGNQYPYKNFVWVKEVARRNPDKTFVIAGSKTNVYADLGQDCGNMIYLGYVSDSENLALMKNARAFIHPSKLEGFGMPPLEALSQGTPVIVSRASCLPEIYGDCAHYIDPDDYNVDIDKLIEEPVADASLVLNKYTWDNAARQWMKIFEDIE